MFSPTIVKIWKKKSVEKYSGAPYLATFLSCGIWVLYGIPIVHPDSILLMTVNGAGAALAVVYLFVFLFCCDRKKRLTVAVVVLGEVVFMAALAILVLTLAHNLKLRSAIVGGISVACTAVMYASPLAIMVCSFLYILISHYVLYIILGCVLLYEYLHTTGKHAYIYGYIKAKFPEMHAMPY